MYQLTAAVHGLWFPAAVCCPVGPTQRSGAKRALSFGYCLHGGAGRRVTVFTPLPSTALALLAAGTVRRVQRICSEH